MTIDTNKTTKEFLVKKMMERWMDERPELVKDIEELATKVAFFNAKWGANLQAEDLIIK